MIYYYYIKLIDWKININIYVLMIINRGIKLLENESQAKRGKQLGISQAGPHRPTIDDFPFSLKQN